MAEFGAKVTKAAGHGSEALHEVGLVGGVAIVGEFLAEDLDEFFDVVEGHAHLVSLHESRLMLQSRQHKLGVHKVSFISHSLDKRVDVSHEADEVLFRFSLDVLQTVARFSNVEEAILADQLLLGFQGLDDVEDGLLNLVSGDAHVGVFGQRLEDLRLDDGSRLSHQFRGDQTGKVLDVASCNEYVVLGHGQLLEDFVESSGRDRLRLILHPGGDQTQESRLVSVPVCGGEQVGKFVKLEADRLVFFTSLNNSVEDLLIE